MTDVRLQRTADGLCTLFIGRMLVFMDLSEAQAGALMRAFGTDADTAPSVSRPGLARSARSVGGRTGRAPSRTRGGTSEQALARLR